jgi:glutaredoxin
VRSICPLIFSLAILWLSLFSRATVEEKAGPSLRIEEQSWDFSEVTAGEKPEHDFTLKNLGGATLTISRVLHSCGGCFEVELGAKELEPGAKTELKVVVLTAGRRGRFRKYVYIESNDSTRHRKRITITGTIRPRTPDEEPDDQPPEEAIDVQHAAPATDRARVCVTYFTSSTCEECKATHKALAKLERAYGSLDVREFDIDKDDDFVLLLKMEKAYGPFRNSPPIIYVGTTLLDGWGEVRTKLDSTIRAHLRDGQAADWPPEILQANQGGSPDYNLIVDKFFSYRLAPVAVNGLVDGINPCAFTAIVFFVSLLARFGKCRREVLAVGACFTFAVFATYFLIGLGLLTLVTAFSVRTGIAKALTYAIAALTAVFGFYSVYDYIVWRRTRSGAEMKLKLPRAVHRRIHAVMKTGNRGTPYLFRGMQRPAEVRRRMRRSSLLAGRRDRR